MQTYLGRTGLGAQETSSQGRGQGAGEKARPKRARAARRSEAGAESAAAAAAARGHRGGGNSGRGGRPGVRAGRLGVGAVFEQLRLLFFGHCSSWEAWLPRDSQIPLQEGEKFVEVGEGGDVVHLENGVDLKFRNGRGEIFER